MRRLLANGLWLPINDHFHQIEFGVRYKRLDTREHLVGDHSERKLVSAAIDMPPANLLRGHIARCTGSKRGPRCHPAFHGLGNPEIGDFYDCAAMQQDVGGLYISMNDA